MKKVLLAVVLLAAMPAFADSEGMYVTGSIGRDSIQIDQGGTDAALRAAGASNVVSSTSENATAWKMGLGYQFNDNFAVEGGYVDLGKGRYDASYSGGSFSGEVKPTGWDFSAVGLMPIDRNTALFGKVGLMRAKVEETQAGNAGNASFSTSNWRATMGLGLKYKLTDSAALRTEVEQYHKLGDAATTGEQSVNLWSVGMDLKF